MPVAIAFSQFGPYHHSRVLSLRSAGIKILPVQVAEASRTYAWTTNSTVVDGVISLTRGTEEDAKFWQVLVASWRIWKRENIRVAFLPSYYPATSLALLLSAKLAGVRCIMMNESHAGTERARGLKRWVKRFLVSLFDGAILGGTPHLRHFESLGMKSTRMVTGYDAIDNAYFTAGAEEARRNTNSHRRALGLPKHYLLSLGRMVKKKNLGVLIDSYALVRRQDPSSDLKLVFVGSGECQEELVARCETLGLHHTDQPERDTTADVLFYGFRQIDENPVFYALAEAFILPSLHEEWGLVVNEAMACGLPVLVSEAVGSAEDLVIPGVNGFHFDPLSSSELAKHIIDIMDDPEKRIRMGAASLIRIQDWGCDNFSRNAKRIIEIVTH